MGFLDDLRDFLPALTGDWLAKSQAAKLQEARAKKLAANEQLLQEEFANDRKVLLGNQFGTAPAGGAVAPCPTTDKAERRRQRLDLVARGMQACPAEAKRAARLRRDMDKVEEARLAKHVYIKYDPNTPEDLKKAPPGYLDATEEDMARFGLVPDDLAPPGTSFRAALYKKDPAVWGDESKPPYVLAFRGSTPAEEDWQNNFAQNANRYSPYYQRAIGLGTSIREYGADQIQLVGHSLGGGLAAAAQGASGRAATTFNSVGLNPGTLARYGSFNATVDEKQIVNYRVEGEALTRAQEHGIVSIFAHRAAGEQVDVPVAHPELAPDDRHGTNEVIASMEQEKLADEAAIAACLQKIQ